MPIKKELVIVLPNKPGTLAAVTRALAKARVNLLAVDAAGGFEHNIVRFVPDNAAKAKAALQRRGYDVGESNVLCAYVEDRRGALAAMAGKLGRAKVNIDYLYATGSSHSGKELIVIHTADPKKAAKVLS
jgi:hypothetical protein